MIAIQVRDTNNYVSIGKEIDNELVLFDVNLMLNRHNWGVCLVGLDGELTTKITKFGKMIEIRKDYLNIDVIYDAEKKSFEIIVLD